VKILKEEIKKLKVSYRVMTIFFFFASLLLAIYEYKLNYNNWWWFIVIGILGIIFYTLDLPRLNKLIRGDNLEKNNS